MAPNGSYAGGPIPFGCDLICVEGDTPIWRFVPTGARPKACPDGKTLTGKKGGPKWGYVGLEIREGSEREIMGIPPHRRGAEELRLAPTVVAERLRVLRDIFTWFAAESISCGEIAKRLNADPDFVHPVHDSRWYGAKITALLKNPIYERLTACHGTPLPRLLGRQGGGTPSSNHDRKPGDTSQSCPLRIDIWSSPSHPNLPPLIEQRTWERVREKLGRPARRPPPRREDLWLGGIAYCSTCNKPLGCQTYRNTSAGTIVRRYCCQTAKKFGTDRGKDNPGGCLHNPISHVHLEAVLGAYLEATERSLDVFKAVSERDKAAYQSLLDEKKKAQDGISNINTRINDYIASNLGGEGEYELFPQYDYKWVVNVTRFATPGAERRSLYIEGFSREGPYNVGIDEIYRYFFINRHRSVEREIAILSEGFDQGLTNLRVLSNPRLVERLEAKLVDVQIKVDILTASLEPLDEGFTALFREVHQASEAVRMLRERIEVGSDRLRAEAARRVVDKMVVSYRSVPYGDKQRALPCGVEVRGIVGDSLSFTLNFEDDDPRNPPRIESSREVSRRVDS